MAENTIESKNVVSRGTQVDREDGASCLEQSVTLDVGPTCPASWIARQIVSGGSYFIPTKKKEKSPRISFPALLVGQFDNIWTSWTIRYGPEVVSWEESLSHGSTGRWAAYFPIFFLSRHIPLSPAAGAGSTYRRHRCLRHGTGKRLSTR